MRVEHFVCDRCGSKGVALNGWPAGWRRGSQASLFRETPDPYESVDLCPECAESLKAWWVK